MLPRFSQTTGFTLIEFIASLSLGLSLVAGVLVIFLQTNRSAIQDEEIARVLENGRFLLRLLSREMAMAGFWGKIVDAGAITLHSSVGVGQDCGDGNAGIWAVEPVAMEFLDDVNSGDVASNFECLPAAAVRVDTDVIAIKRTADANTKDAAIVENQLYLRSAGSRGEVFLGRGVSTPPLPDYAATNWAVMPQVFYIRDYSIYPGDSIPAFCRAFLDSSASPDMRNECLVEGVENLQIEFGVDTDSDWMVNYYDPSPTTAEIQESVSARIHILVRSVNVIPGYINDKSFALGLTRLVAANDGYYRRVFSSTVLLRNPTELVGLGMH